MAASPPAGVPVGLATKAGLSGALVAFLSALAAYQDGRTPEAMTALVVAGGTLAAVLWGRYQQAVAARRQTPLTAPTYFAGTLGGSSTTGTQVSWESVPVGATVVPDDAEPADAERFRKGGFPPEPDPDTAKLLAEGAVGADPDDGADD